MDLHTCCLYMCGCCLFLHVLYVSVMLLARRGREGAGAPLAQRGRGAEFNHRACGAARADVGEIVTVIHLYGKIWKNGDRSILPGRCMAEN